MEREVILDFACCNCKHSIGVTLKCSGKGLSACHAAVAAVDIPCPTCSSINELVFDPSGTQIDDWHAQGTYLPSHNRIMVGTR